MRAKNFVKCISLVMAIVFSSTTVAQAAPKCYSIDIPTEYGKVTQRWKAATAVPGKSGNSVQRLVVSGKMTEAPDYCLLSTDHSNKTVILIEDAHASLEAQENIAHIINYAVTEEQLPMVSVEGGVGPLDLGQFRSFPVHEARNTVAYDYMKKGVFSGSEFGSITSEKPFHFFGAEDKDLLLDNVNTYAAVIEEGQVLAHAITAMEERVQELISYMYSPEQQDFADLCRSYRSGATSYATIFSEFYQYADRYLGEGLMAYPKLYQFREKLVANSDTSLDMTGILKEMDSVMYLIAEAMARTAETRTIGRWQKDLGTLKNVYSVTAANSDLACLRADSKRYDLVAIIQGINQLSNAYNLTPLSLPKKGADYKQLLWRIMDFYAQAEKRNDSLVENTIREMVNTHASESILLAGGYHTEGITKRLRNEGISYVVVTPTISDTGKMLPYQEKMTGNLFPFAMSTSTILASYVTDMDKTFQRFVFPAIAEAILSAAESDSEKARLILKKLETLGDADKQALMRVIHEEYQSLRKSSDIVGRDEVGDAVEQTLFREKLVGALSAFLADSANSSEVLRRPNELPIVQPDGLPEATGENQNDTQARIYQAKSRQESSSCGKEVYAEKSRQFFNDLLFSFVDVLSLAVYICLVFSDVVVSYVSKQMKRCGIGTKSQMYICMSLFLSLFVFLPGAMSAPKATTNGMDNDTTIESLCDQVVVSADESLQQAVADVEKLIAHIPQDKDAYQSWKRQLENTISESVHACSRADLRKAENKEAVETLVMYVILAPLDSPANYLFDIVDVVPEDNELKPYTYFLMSYYALLRSVSSPTDDYTNYYKSFAELTYGKWREYNTPVNPDYATWEKYKQKIVNTARLDVMAGEDGDVRYVQEIGTPQETLLTAAEDLKEIVNAVNTYNSRDTWQMVFDIAFSNILNACVTADLRNIENRDALIQGVVAIMYSPLDLPDSYLVKIANQLPENAMKGRIFLHISHDALLYSITSATTADQSDYFYSVAKTYYDEGCKRIDLKPYVDTWDKFENNIRQEVAKQNEAAVYEETQLPMERSEAIDGEAAKGAGKYVLAAGVSLIVISCMILYLIVDLIVDIAYDLVRLIGLFIGWLAKKIWKNNGDSDTPHAIKRSFVSVQSTQKTLQQSVNDAFVREVTWERDDDIIDFAVIKRVLACDVEAGRIAAKDIKSITIQVVSEDHPLLQKGLIAELGYRNNEGQICVVVHKSLIAEAGYYAEGKGKMLLNRYILPHAIRDVVRGGHCHDIGQEGVDTTGTVWPDLGTPDDFQAVDHFLRHCMVRARAEEWLCLDEALIDQDIFKKAKQSIVPENKLILLYEEETYESFMELTKGMRAPFAEYIDVRAIAKDQSVADVLQEHEKERAIMLIPEEVRGAGDSDLHYLIINPDSSRHLMAFVSVLKALVIFQSNGGELALQEQFMSLENNIFILNDEILKNRLSAKVEQCMRQRMVKAAA